MSFSSAGYQLLPVLPELVLAVGAMALLMLGAYRGEGTTRLVTTLATAIDEVEQLAKPVVLKQMEAKSNGKEAVPVQK